MIFHLNCNHAVNTSNSQHQTCFTLRIDDRTTKHSATGMRTVLGEGRPTSLRAELRNFFFFVSSFLSAIDDSMVTTSSPP